MLQNIKVEVAFTFMLLKYLNSHKEGVIYFAAQTRPEVCYCTFLGRHLFCEMESLQLFSPFFAVNEQR